MLDFSFFSPKTHCYTIFSIDIVGGGDTMKRWVYANKKRSIAKIFGLKNIIFSLLLVGVVVVGSKTLMDNRAMKISKDMSGDVPSWSWVLGGRSITIDAGHGGVDPGAIGITKTLEKDINLAVSKRLQLLFTQAGSKVIMLRDEDRDFGTSPALLQRKREDLAYRTQVAVESHADIYLSIHGNSFPDATQYGPQVFYHPESKGGKALAESIQESLNRLSTKKRVAKANQSYFILKNTDMTAVTIEVGFLSNPTEEAKLINADYQQQLAMAIFEGVGYYAMEMKPVLNDD